MLRILQVFEPGFDGVFRHVEGLTNYLLERPEWKVGVVYSSVRTSERLPLMIDRVQRAGGPAYDLKTGRSPGVSDIRSFLGLWQVVNTFQPDIIHAHSSKGGALARILSFFRPTPCVYTPNAYYGMGGREGLSTTLFNLIESCLKPCAFSIHVSPEESDFAFSELGIAREVGQIPNAVDFDQFFPVEDSEERIGLRQEFGLPPNSIVLGSIGRISFQKDPETLYRSFARALESLPDLPLYLLHVGKGSPAEELRLNQLAEHLGIEANLVRPPYRSDPEVFYRAMDAFCLSSRYEGLPFTVLEALASDLPLILTDAPGLRSFRDPRYRLNHVFYGDVEDPVSMGDAICRWVCSREVKSNHRAKSRDHFSIPVCYGRIESLYRMMGFGA